MVDNAKPSLNPANEGSMVGMMQQVLQKFLQGVDDMLPAKVVAYDRASNMATVQPLIMMVTTAGDTIQRAPVASVPVFQIGAGGFVLNFNLNAGDLGWIKANDRDISHFIRSFSQQKPNTFRLHSFEDGVFFPNVLTGFTIDEEDAENVVLQTLDGSQRVAIWPDKIKITSDSEIILDAPVTRILGDLYAGDGYGGTGEAHFAGDIFVDGDVFGDADGTTISLNTHVHSGVQTGASNTGQPVP